MTPSQVLSALLPDRIFRLPQAGSPVYVTREQYLSGDVGQKLSIAQRWAQLNPDFAVNVTAVHRLALLAGAGMLERGSGVIVNVASMYGFVARWDIPGAASYSATKAAVVNLTRELGAQWARRGVRVNGLAPGYFPSEMTADGLDDDRFRERLERRCPAGRPGRADELDGALLFLASDASSYVCGQTVVVDGGWTAV